MVILGSEDGMGKFHTGSTHSCAKKIKLLYNFAADTESELREERTKSMLDLPNCRHNIISSILQTARNEHDF
jgi:hypothetical protein